MPSDRNQYPQEAIHIEHELDMLVNQIGLRKACEYSYREHIIWLHHKLPTAHLSRGGLIAWLSMMDSMRTSPMFPNDLTPQEYYGCCR